jgi:parallel beta-helix repeat protein
MASGRGRLRPERGLIICRMRRIPLLLAILGTTLSLRAATFTVTSNASSGAGSLREAITLANSTPGADTIAFAIGSGEQTIQLDAQLPSITDALTIDGTTQPGYAGTQLITVRGVGSGGGSFSAFSLQATTTIRALIIEEFFEGIFGPSNNNVIDDNIITLSTTEMQGIAFSGSNNTITGNTVSAGNGTGVYLTGSSNTVQGNRIGGDLGLSVSGSNNQIGGTDTNAGNTITGSDNPATIGGTGNVLQGNHISGGTSFGALLVSGSNHVIGGTTSSARNIIIGNPALQLNATGTTFAGNYFNLDEEGTPAGVAGNIAIRTNSTATGNTFGGSINARNYIAGQVLLRAPNNTFDRNIIGGTPGETPTDGFFWIESDSSNTTLTNNLFLMRIEIYAGTGHLSRGNTFRDPSRGLELQPFMPNDPGDADVGPNNQQNHPEITSAVDGPGGSTIDGTLSSTPSTTFTIEFFNGAACRDSNPIGTMSVTTNASGDAPFTFNTPVHTNVVTASATDPGNNTSPMAPCVTTASAALVFISDITANEDDGAAVFTITRSPAQPQEVVVAVDTQPGTASQGADYERVTTTVTFEPGETTKSVEIPIVDDTLTEPNETFTVTLSKPASPGDYTITDASALGTIVDNDIVLITVDDASIPESAGNAQVMVRLSSALSSTLTLSYAASQNTATAGQDFTPSSGTLTFAPGETQKQITIPIVQDQSAEGIESFFVTVSNPSAAGTVTIVDGTGEVTILDDDVVLISVLDAQVAESQSNAQVTVVLSMPPSTALTLNYTIIDGSATAGLDFLAASGTLTFAPGETQKQIAIPIVQDQSTEGIESFFVTVSNPSAGSTVTIVDGTGEVTIVDDDIVVISILDARVSEGESNAEVMVVLSAPATAALTVDYTIAGGTATAGLDFLAASGTLTFAPGETEKGIPVTTFRDRINEPSETILVHLSNPSGGTIVHEVGTVVLTNVETSTRRRAVRK